MYYASSRSHQLHIACLKGMAMVTYFALQQQGHCLKSSMRMRSAGRFFIFFVQNIVHQQHKGVALCKRHLYDSSCCMPDTEKAASLGRRVPVYYFSIDHDLLLI